MVKNFTLFHWVDGFHESESTIKEPLVLNMDSVDSLLTQLLDPLIFDPGDEIVEALLRKI